VKGYVAGWVQALVILGAAASMVGCATPTAPHARIATLQEVAEADANAVYRIGRGDVLDIKFRHYPELNEEVTVRPDGRISVQVAHDVMAAGKTPAELTTALVESGKKQLSNPDITVIVRSFSSQRAYVTGEVYRPGVVALDGNVSVLQAVAAVGGFLETARLEGIVLIRRSAEGAPLAAILDLESVVDGADLEQDIALRPYDVVFVPRTPIANLNLWVDQYLRKSMPLPLDFGISYRLDGGRD
jgi:protein involved in polysaccharide export with SLBB domain